MGIWKRLWLVVRSGVLSLKNLPPGVLIKNKQLAPGVYRTINSVFHTPLQEKICNKSK